MGFSPAGTTASIRPATRPPSTPLLCHEIHCDYGAVCEVGADGFPRCTCHFNCTFGGGGGGGAAATMAMMAPGTRFEPVCASDLRLYPSECDMLKEGCQRQRELR